MKLNSLEEDNLIACGDGIYISNDFGLNWSEMKNVFKFDSKELDRNTIKVNDSIFSIHEVYGIFKRINDKF